MKIANFNTKLSQLELVTLPGRPEPVLLKQPSQFWDAPYIHNEANILKDINHPNVRKLIAFNPTTRRLYLEFIDAPTLQDLTNQATYQTDPARVQRILQNLAETLADLHEGKHCTSRLVHNDLKPANVLVLDSQVKIIDFGQAFIHGQKPTYLTEREMGTPIGTAAFIAPEKWDCDYTKGQASDVFAFGVLAFVATTGKFPFSGDRTQLEHNIKNEKTISPFVAGVPISRNIAAIVLDCLAKHPQGRPSMRQVSKSLAMTLKIQPMQIS